MAMILYGGAASPYFRKVRVALLEKGLAHEMRGLSPFPPSPELLAMNPLGKIPVLEEDGTYIPDSSVICAYLERIRPEPALYPEDAKQYARALFLEEYADTKIAEGLAVMFMERFIHPTFFHRPTDEAAVQKALATQVPPVCNWLESQLKDNLPLVGDRLTIADVAVGTQLQAFGLAREPIDPRRWPRLARYTEFLYTLPSFQQSLARS